MASDDRLVRKCAPELADLARSVLDGFPPSGRRSEVLRLLAAGDHAQAHNVLAKIGQVDRKARFARYTISRSPRQITRVCDACAGSGNKLTVAAPLTFEACDECKGLGGFE